MDYGKEQLNKLLLTMDEEATLLLNHEKRVRYPVVIVGGSALLLRDLTNRPTTRDIDVLDFHETLRGVLSNYAAVSNAVATYIDQIPYNFEDRLERIELSTKTIEFLTPSIEDIAVMKLYGWRHNDQQDLESLVEHERLDWIALDHLVYDPAEAQASALSPRRYSEMVSTYEKFARRHGHDPNV